MRPIFETLRLFAREMTLADLDFVAGMLSDPEVMRYYPRLLTREESVGWVHREVEHYAAHGHGRWLILDKFGGNPVGQVGLRTGLVEGAVETEVVWMIDRSFWRKGYATEATAGSLDHGFQVVGLVRAIAFIRPENLASRCVATKLGMDPHRRIEHNGLDHDVYRIGRETWEARGA